MLGQENGDRDRSRAGPSKGSKRIRDAPAGRESPTKPCGIRGAARSLVRRPPSITRAIFVASCALACACSSILGIENTIDETEAFDWPRDGGGRGRGEVDGGGDGALAANDARTDGGDPGSDASADAVV